MHLNTTSVKRRIKRGQSLSFLSIHGYITETAQKEIVHIIPVKAQGISCFVLHITLVSVSVTDFTDQ